MEVILPRNFLQTDGSLFVKVDTTDQSKSYRSRWYDVWAAVVSVNTMCLRHQKGGIANLYPGLNVVIARPGSTVQSGAGGSNGTQNVAVA